MTAFNIIRSMTKRGNAIIGSGCYSAAISSTTDTAKIIKIGNNMNDPWLDYYKVISANQKSPVVPKLYSMFIDKEYSYYTCVMERLSHAAIDYVAAWEARDLCKEFAEGWHNSESFIEMAKEYPAFIPDVNAMHDLLLLIKDSGYAKGFRVDLHAGNFMYRENTIVVTDPWAEHDMDDIVDVSDWASEHCN